MFAVIDVLHVDILMWSVLVSVIAPPVVGFLTGLNTSPGVKSAINLVLACINVAVTTIIVDDTGALISKSAVISAVAAYLMSRGVYKDFYKPAGVTSSYVEVTDESGFPGGDPAGVPKEAVVTYLVPGKLADVGIKAA